MNKPKVSVVIPAYNAENYVNRAIESVLSQTMPPFEIIVIDDGSQDGTYTRASSYGGIVKCYKQANSGPASARNFAIKKSKGDYIAFLDADDYWFESHLEFFYRAFTKHDLLPWYASSYEIHHLNNRIETISYTSSVKPIKIDYFKSQSRKNYFWTGVMIIRKGVLREHNYFNPSLYTGEDIDLWFRIALRYPKIVYSSNISSCYKKEPDSITFNKELYSAELIKDFIRRQEDYIEKNKITSKNYYPLLNSYYYTFFKRSIKFSKKEYLYEIYKSNKNYVCLLIKILSFVIYFAPPFLLETINNVYLLKSKPHQ